MYFESELCVAHAGLKLHSHGRPRTFEKICLFIHLLFIHILNFIDFLKYLNVITVCMHMLNLCSRDSQRTASGEPILCVEDVRCGE